MLEGTSLFIYFSQKQKNYIYFTKNYFIKKKNKLGLKIGILVSI